MKLASFWVVLALATLPTGALVSFIIYQLLKGGSKGGVSLSKSSPRLERFRSQHKVLFNMLISSYSLLFFAALLWMFYEIIARHLDLPAFSVIWFLSLMVVEAVVTVLSTTRYQRHVLGKLPPRPQSDSPDNAIKEWQLRYSNEMANTYLLYLFPTLLIALCVIIVWVALLWLYTILP